MTSYDLLFGKTGLKFASYLPVAGENVLFFDISRLPGPPSLKAALDSAERLERDVREKRRVDLFPVTLLFHDERHPMPAELAVGREDKAAVLFQELGARQTL